MRRYRPRYSGSGTYRRRYYRGSGAYTVNSGPWANIGQNLGSMAGRAVAGPVGNMLGGWLGRRAFHYGARLFGSGAYRRRRRITGSGAYHVDDKLSPQIPTFGKDGDSVEISHREYIGDIISSPVAGATKIYKFAITPGESATFPWLSAIAQPDFQQYKFSGCVFQFRSFSSDALNSTNTALGAIVAGVDYDFSSEDFTNRSQVENLSWSTACKPSLTTDIPVECASRQTALGGGLLYVLNQAGTPSQGVDLKTYMLGKLYILVTGVQGTSVNLGSLYVTYKIRLFKPCIQAPLSNANIVKLYRTGPTNASPLGTATQTTDQTCDTLGCSFTGTVMSINPQRLIPGSRFMLIFQWVGAVNTVVPPVPNTSTGYVGCTPQLAFMSNVGVPDSYANIIAPLSASVSDTQCLIAAEIVISDTVAQTGCSITFPSGTLPITSRLAIYICQRNGVATTNIGYFAGY